MNNRKEHDLLGDETLPDTAWYGIQTLRALRNFNTSGVPIHQFQDLINTLTMVKQASAEANHELGLLSSKKTNAIRQACIRIREGELHNQFVVDLIQGGAGVSTNMNANEVIANLALSIMGHEKGEYQYLHPNNDVNKSQTNNDAYATAARLSIVLSTQTLTHALSSIKSSFEKKAEEFARTPLVKGTHLQDTATKMLGSEFADFAASLKEEIVNIQSACTQLCATNLNSTSQYQTNSVHPDYTKSTIKHLTHISALPITSDKESSDNHSDMEAFVKTSAIQRKLAIKLAKICNAICILSNDPRTNFNEINLPITQAGSSLVPGVVSPVIPEAVSQTAFQVIGHDVTVCMAAEAGSQQLNAMEPVIIYNILNSMKMLSSAIYMLNHRCIRGITANSPPIQLNIPDSRMLAALMPDLSYGTHPLNHLSSAAANTSPMKTAV
ncbi:lyase family protein [Neptunomonas japonica]|uniref:Aspartate ammonia-lyase n=1 Tax=Neptunomonas japonica JAMM 1380 TaxID=1441457 RepID=A0A7R6PCF9_9GAMM|nr:lyase family protein [Neptunomonas japonica]BBB31159.1 aspartate ammonia-lyase [Neptunomonas japonica JAMM 1380]